MQHVLETNVRDSVRKLREARGWTIQELGRRIGADAATATRLLSGDRHISLVYLEKLAEAFGVAPVDLLGEVPEPLFVTCPQCLGRGVVSRG